MMKNVHVGWGPVGMTIIKEPSKPKLKLNRINHTGEKDSEFKLEIISKYEELPVWQSSNENVAKVDLDGNVTLLNEGTAIITVTSGKLTGKCVIKVVLSAEQEFLRDVANGGVITLTEDLELSEMVWIEKDVTINLNGKSITTTTTTTSGKCVLFYIKDSKLTINGEGDIKVESGGTDIAVWADTDAEVIINSGNFHGIGNSNGSDLIYAKEGMITINGGSFKLDNMDTKNFAEDQYSLLNVYGANQTTALNYIVVKGGKFYGFNPANNVSEGKGTNFVADGYEATEINGEWNVTKKPGTPEQPEPSKLDTSKIYYGVIPFVDYENVVTDGLHLINKELILKAVNSGNISLANLKPGQLFEISHKEGDIMVVLMSNFNAYIKNPLGEDLYEFADANGMTLIKGFKLFGELVQNTANTLVYVK